VTHRWRVQATWTVEDEPKSYAPIFTRTRFGAARTRRSIEQTLWHFPTLDVKVERVSRQAAEAEQERRASERRPPEPVHLMTDMTAATTACGRDARTASNLAVAEMFQMSSNQCEDCARTVSP
jgi:hypothetical protein